MLSHHQRHVGLLDLEGVHVIHIVVYVLVVVMVVAAVVVIIPIVMFVSEWLLVVFSCLLHILPLDVQTIIMDGILNMITTILGEQMNSMQNVSVQDFLSTWGVWTCLGGAMG